MGLGASGASSPGRAPGGGRRQIDLPRRKIYLTPATLDRLSYDSTYGDSVFYLWWAKNQLRRALGVDGPFLEATRRAATTLLNAINDVIPDDVAPLQTPEKQKEVMGYGHI